MSNKTQLQTNNTNLDALITRVNSAKNTAASLPSAGSGGGGSIETCTVEIIQRGVVGPSPEEPSFYYTDANMTVQNYTGRSTTLTVVKNTILTAINLEARGELSGSCSEISYIQGNYSIQITGNCTFVIS